METGFFRFVNKEENDPKRVYSSVLWCVGLSSAVFAVFAVLCSPVMAHALQIDGHSDFVAVMCVTVAIDAFCCIPMAYLRYKNRSAKFAMVNLIMIAVNIFFNIFFLLVCPWLHNVAPASVDWFYNPSYSVGYVFVANLISTLSKVALLSREIRESDFLIDRNLLAKMLRYSFPLLILGVAGIMNQTLDKILFPVIYTWSGHSVAEAQAQLGIYGACFKVAMVMMMFTQAFRYAYEPFVFAQNKGGDKKKEYADAMKFFVIFSWLIFLGMNFFIDVLKLLIAPNY
jgi:O-antigen/teichoic acid export membrane protein